MKFNWGVGITIVIAAFIIFILSFVYRASQTNADLTSEDYYEQEINYQQTIDAKNNAIDFKKDFKFLQSSDLFIIDFPEGIGAIEDGDVHFYRPEDADKDKYFKIELNESKMAIPLSSLEQGGYKLTITWSKDGKEFIVEEKINIE